MAPFARSIVRRSAELLVIGLGILLALETSARVYLFGLAGLVPARINSEHALTQTGFTQPSSLPGLSFELKPNVDGFFKLVPFRTNSRGLRDREYSQEKPEGCFRAAVLGSSFALPTGVAIEDAFHSLLEERLSREHAPTCFEFVNFAVGMYSAENMVVVLESRALAYDPDLILFHVTKLSAPALHGSPARARPAALHALPRPERSYPILQSFLFRLVAARLAPDAVPPVGRIGWLERRFMDVRAGFSPAHAPAPAGATPPASAAARGALLPRLAEIARRSGTALAVIRLEFQAVPRDRSALEIEAHVREHGIPYFDTRDAFRGTRYRDLWVHPLDPHPNARAHAIFADAIEGFLRREALLPGARS